MQDNNNLYQKAKIYHFKRKNRQINSNHRIKTRCLPNCTKMQNAFANVHHIMQNAKLGISQHKVQDICMLPSRRRPCRSKIAQCILQRRLAQVRLNILRFSIVGPGRVGDTNEHAQMANKSKKEIGPNMFCRGSTTKADQKTKTFVSILSFQTLDVRFLIWF